MITRTLSLFLERARYRPDFPVKGFQTRDEACEWTLRFVDWYNTTHRHTGLKFLTPNQRHQVQSENIFAKRKQVYEAEKAKHPSRWSREIRNWNLKEQVWINPEKTVENEANKKQIN